MNKLDTKTRAQILHMLVEGTSMRAISRMTGVSINTVTKLLVSYMVGDRSANAAAEFMHDVAFRLANRVQLTSDGHAAYLIGVESAFGSDEDYAQLVKIYGTPRRVLMSATARRSASA